MNYKVSFQELAEIQKEILSKQQPTTLDKARKQVETLKRTSSQKINKKWSLFILYNTFIVEFYITTSVQRIFNNENIVSEHIKELTIFQVAGSDQK